MPMELNADLNLFFPMVGTTQAVLKSYEKGSGSVTFTRATTATRVNPDTGLIEAVASGEAREDGRIYKNRLYYSEDFSNAIWSKTDMTVSGDNEIAPNGKAVAQSIVASAGNGTCLQGCGDISRARYGSIYLKRKTGSGTIQITLDNGSTWTTVVVTSAWTRFGAGQTLVTPTFGIRIVTSGDAVYAFGAQLEDGSSATRYVKSGSNPAYAPRGILIEGQRTNLFTYSEQLNDASWAATAVTVTANSVAAPDGNTTAEKIAETTANSYHWVTKNPSMSSSTKYTLSAFVQYGTRAWVYLVATAKSGTSYAKFFNINTGAVGGNGVWSAPESYTIEWMGNGWFRISITIDSATGATATDTYLGIASADGTASYTGVATEYMYGWGLQIEQGEFPTSYIPTTSVTVTRNADVFSIPTSGNIPDGANAFTLMTCYEKIGLTATLDGSDQAIHIGTYATQCFVGLGIYYATKWTVLVDFATVWDMVGNVGSWPLNDVSRVAVRLQTDRKTFHVYRNGSSGGLTPYVASVAKSGNWAGSPSTINFAPGGPGMGHHLKYVMVSTKSLSDSEMAAVTA